MAHDQESAAGGAADSDKPALVVGMIGISKGGSQRIIEYRHGLLEGYAVLLEVRRSLLAVPLEAHCAPSRLWSAMDV